MNNFNIVGKIHTIKSLDKIAYITVCIKSVYSRDEKYDYLDIISFSPDWINKYFTAGKWIGVSGHISNNSYTDKDGNKKYKLDLIADRIFFVGDKKDSEEANSIEDEGLPWEI